MNKLIFELDSGLQSILSRKKDWEMLYRDSASTNPFLSWEWVYYWASNFSIPENIRILIGKLDNVVCCIVPLQKDGSDIAFLRDAEYADYGGILVTKNLNHNHIKSIIDRIMQESNKLSLDAIRSDSIEFKLIESLIESKSIQPVATYICDNPYVAKQDDFEVYYKARSKKLRQEIRTTENHLRRIGEYNFVEKVQGESYEELLDKLAEFHLKRQDVKVGKSIFSNINALKFFKKAPKHLNTSNCQLHMSAILLKHQVISAALSIKNKSTLYYWIPSFDEDIPNVSLGKLHIKFLIEKCHNQNMAFDFMGGDEQYKYQWADSSLSIKNYTFFKSSHRKILYQSEQYMKQLLKDKLRENEFFKKARIAISKFYL